MGMHEVHCRHGFSARQRLAVESWSAVVVLWFILAECHLATRVLSAKTVSQHLG